MVVRLGGDEVCIIAIFRDIETATLLVGIRHLGVERSFGPLAHLDTSLDLANPEAGD